MTAPQNPGPSPKSTVPAAPASRSRGRPGEGRRTMPASRPSSTASRLRTRNTWPQGVTASSSGTAPSVMFPNRSWSFTTPIRPWEGWLSVQTGNTSGIPVATRIAGRSPSMRCAVMSISEESLINPPAESHKTGSNLRDMILGGQDGLVNVLGVVLGATAATTDTKVIISIGLAATFAESLAMGAVAYTSFMAEKEHYDSEVAREKREMKEMPEAEK